MRRWRYDFPAAGALMLLPLLLFAPVALGGKTILPADVLYTFQPYRAVAEELGVGQPQNPLLADLILENYPWKRFLVTAFRERSLPLWDPYLFTGHPFLANGQHSGLYPLTWLSLAFPIPRAFGIFITLQLGLAGVFMYTLARVIGARRHGAFLAGIVFQFSGFMVASAVHPMIVAGASWLPLLLACADLIVRRAPFLRRASVLPWALLGAVALGLQILAGHAEMTYFVLLVTGAFVAWRLLYLLFTYPRSAWREVVLGPAVGLVAMVSLGLALGAVQLLPLYEIVSRSFRQGAVSLADVLGWAYPKRRIIAFLVPNFFGNPAHHVVWDFFSGRYVAATVNAHGDPITAFDWGIKNYVEGAAYVGLLPLALALIAVLHPPTGGDVPPRGIRAFVWRWLRHPYVPFFAALALFSLGCIFGTPIYALVYALPFLSQSHSPFRWVFPLTVAVAALTALGATAVAEVRRTHGPEGRRAARPQVRWLRFLLFDTAPGVVSLTAAAFIWGGVAVLGGLWTSRVLFTRIEPLVERVFWALAGASYAFPDHRVFYAYLFPWIQNAGLFLLASGIVLRVSRCPIYWPQKWPGGGEKPLPIWELLAVVVLVVDLVTFGVGFNPATEPQWLTYEPPMVKFLRQQEGVWRFSTFDPHGKRTFIANAGMFYDLQDVRGYDSLFTAQYARYMGWIEPQGELLYNRIAPFRSLDSLDSPWMDLLNVKYIITEEEIPLPKYRLVYEDEAVRVYENLGAAPRAFTQPISATIVVPDVEAVGALITRYDPRAYVIVEEAADGWIGEKPPLPVSTHGQGGPLRPQQVTAYTPNEVRVKVEADGPVWLVLTDAFFPGWKAFVRPPGADEAAEQEVPIARVAGNFRGVLLKGSAEVRFKYTPDSVKIGAFVSFLGGMVWLFLAVVWMWRRLYRDPGEGSTARRVAKNSIAPILLTTFNRLVDFAFAALMLRILGPANAGDYYYAVNVFLWFDIITNFGLNTYLTREVARHREQARRYLLNTTALRLALSVASVPLLAIFIGLRQTVIAAVTAPASMQAIGAMVLLYVGLIPNSISTGLTALFYAYERAEYPAAVTSISTLLKVTLGVGVLMAGWGIVGLAGAAIAVNLVTLLILGTLAVRTLPDLRARSAPPLRAPSEGALRREMLRESWPLMVNHLLATLFFKVDVFLVEAMRGSDALGRYSIGYKLLEAINIVPAMFTLALFPVISRQARENRAAFTRHYRLGAKILAALAMPVALISTLLAREMVLILAGREYLPGAALALRLMVWSIPIGWMNSLTQYVLIALDRQRYLTRAYAIAFGLTLGANLALIGRWGYFASAALHILSEAALFLLFALDVRREIGPVGWRQIVEKPLMATVVAGLVALPLFWRNQLLAAIVALFVYLVAAWRSSFFTPEEQVLLAPLLPHRGMVREGEA